MNKDITDYSKKLKELGITHEIVEHPELKTPPETLGYLGLTLSDGASTLVLKSKDDNFYALIRRDDCKTDFKQIKKILGVDNLRLATPEEFTQFTKLPVGAARIYLPQVSKTIIDKKILDKEYVVGGSGSFTSSIKYKTSDLLKIPGSIVADVSEIESEARKGSKVYSGIRATGRLHLGNYMGAVKGMLELQDKYDCVFAVVDLAAITTPYDPKTLKQSVRDIIIDYLAAGLDPKKCLIEVQSTVPEHMELAYYLSTIYPVSRLEDLPTYKDKKAQHPKYVNMGLLYYPIEMAADILLYKAELVPVGIDQEPHIEVTREIARKFNSMFPSAGSGQVTFPEPKRFATPGQYVPSLTGIGKMSKSIEGSFITLNDSLEDIKAHIAKAPTDSGTQGGELPREGGVANLFDLLRLFESEEVFSNFVQDYQDKKIRYSDMKEVLASAIYKELKPLQEKRKEFEENPKIVDEIIEEHTEKCRVRAQQTIKEVKEKMGLL